MRKDDLIRLRHMLDAAKEVILFAKNKTRSLKDAIITKFALILLCVGIIVGIIIVPLILFDFFGPTSEDERKFIKIYENIEGGTFDFSGEYKSKAIISANKKVEFYIYSVRYYINKQFYESIAGKAYLFSWDEIPGNDSEGFVDFLKRNYSINWVKGAKIEKIDDGKTIKVSTDNNSLLLRLNDEKTKAFLNIGSDGFIEFIVRSEDGKLSVYAINWPDNIFVKFCPENSREVDNNNMACADVMLEKRKADYPMIEYSSNQSYYFIKELRFVTGGIQSLRIQSFFQSENKENVFEIEPYGTYLQIQLQKYMYVLALLGVVIIFFQFYEFAIKYFKK